MTERIIVVDVGNSRVKAGLVDLGAAAGGGTDAAPLPDVVDVVHLPVKERMQWQPLQDWLHSADASDATWWLASVNPPVLESLVRWLGENGLRHHELRDPSRLPLTVDLPRPEAAGIDRLLNAVAANAVRPREKPAIIIDAGSAMTIDAVSADGTFLGGAILPGFTLAARALHEFTYWLPLVEPGGAPPCPLGKNTTDALAAGLYWGTVGAVRELLDRIVAHLTWTAPHILLTGGDAPRLAPHLGRPYSHLPHLTLQGIALAITDPRPPPTRSAR